MTPAAYGRDLAHVHDTGFGDFARGAATGVLRELRRAGVGPGLVVDLGCGSGIWARTLTDAGYDVLGIDMSAALLTIARRRAPSATFVHGSLHDAQLPPCAAVTALGEVLNYAFDPRAGRAAVARLLGRVHGALPPGGLLLFDVAVRGRERPQARRAWYEGEGWLLCLEASEERESPVLTRRIAVFRRARRTWRRTDEVHRLHLYDPDELRADLAAAGFESRVLRRWGPLRLPRGHVAFVATRT